MDSILITDPGSVDIDDILSIALYTFFCKKNKAFSHKIVCTHHYAEKRTDIVRVILEHLNADIPVYTSEYNKNLEEFRNLNPLFPSKIFGEPVYDADTVSEKPWFPAFGKAYEELLEKSGAKREYQDAKPMLISELEKHSPENKLKIICVAPPFDLQDIPTELYKNMDLWMMGGGFHEKDSFVTTQAGYNWGICPDVTNNVLSKLAESGTTAKVVTSSIARYTQTEIKLHVYEKWCKLAEGDCPLITKAIMNDWLACNRGNKLTAHKNLCDPLTLVLALAFDFDFDCEFVPAYCKIANHEKYQHYMEKIDVFPLIEVSNGRPNVLFASKFDISATTYITELLDDILFPLDKEKFCRSLTHNFDPTLLPKNKWVIQVVGKCTLYSKEATAFIKSFLKYHIQLKKDQELYPILEYGLTGFTDFKGRTDVNVAVEMVADELDIPVIANTVGLHTREVIMSGARYSKTALLYTLVENGRFGDDIEITDNICDELICFDGGVQSFAQCVNCLSYGKSVLSFNFLNESASNSTLSEVLSSNFLNESASNSTLSEVLSSNFLNESAPNGPSKYLSTILLKKLYYCKTEEECITVLQRYMEDVELFDNTKQDSSTKQALFDNSWAKFIKEKLWLKFAKYLTFHEFIYC
jgi:inosine-uridine nucleoside N-ribohydrolase